MSIMLAETREAPARVEAMLRQDAEAYAALARDLAARPPRFAATVARGSSDHAATYLAMLTGIVGGIATASIPPSLVTRYGARLELEGALVTSLSQSGASPDIVATLAAAREAGGTTVAIVNAEGSPLASTAGHVLPQRAGVEHSVAATKSFICTLAVAARLVAVWRQDQALLDALQRLPERLEAALACDWSAAVPRLVEASSLYVVGRGPCLGVAQESALKLKETSFLHAEALSAAEIRHGPRAVIGEGFPLFAYALADAGGGDTATFAAELADAGAEVIVASPKPSAGLHLPLPEPLHPLLDPIIAIQAFYPMAVSLAVARGQDPDSPRGLRKVTETI
ncbi:MAG TPA: SIS domain-containing protein [Geminicoccaceae bacterium]|nr:SIS domain-containing protein [Geminicoccus sp.]HMU53192.1 SIS domain-containing protein [Geminicoccaceae bacterium]